MVRTNRVKILFASGVAIFAAASASAGQITQVCSSGSTVIASYTAASASTGVQPNTCYTVSYAQRSTDAAKGEKFNGTIYLRGQPFTLSSRAVPSTYSFAAYDRLASCLLKCPNSMSAATAKAIADKRKASTTAKSTPKKTASSTTATAQKGSGHDTNSDQTNTQVVDAKNGSSDPKPTQTNSPAPKDNAISEYRQMKDEGKTQVDTTKSSDGTVTKKSYTDANGNHKLDDDEEVTSTTIGHLDGTRFVASETITSGDVANDADTVTLKDPQGNTHTFYNTKDAQNYANAKGIADAKFTKDGKTYKIDPRTGELVADRDAKSKNAGKTEEQIKAEAMNATDPCSESLRLIVDRNKGNYNAPEVKNFRCQGTQAWAKGAEVANQVLTGAGRAVVNTMGATAAQNAAQGGTLIDAQEASAKMAKTSFTYETALGVANLAATAKLAAAANKHKDNVGKLQAWKESQKGGNAYSGDDFETAATSKAQYDAAIKEQTGARNLASIAAMKTALTAAQSAAAAIVAKNNQKAAEKNVALARQAAKTTSDNTFGFDPNSLAPAQQPPQFDPNAMAANGTTDSGAATTTDNVDPNAPTGALLGDGNDLSGGDDSLNAPTAGAFKEGTTAGGPGGGAPGAGATGGGSGGGTPTAQDESKAAYASEFGTKERYESGGGGGYAPKTGGAAAAKGGDSGIDLNGLLAQFLPKADDESAKHSILDSVAFGGNRHIATEEPASYLDKNADLFQRIHETMSEKNRRGQLGI